MIPPMPIRYFDNPKYDSPEREALKAEIDSIFESFNLQKPEMGKYISWSVNDSFSNISDDEIYQESGLEDMSMSQIKRAIAINAKHAVMQLLDSLPNGSILFNEPVTDDGKGKRRKSIYERFGFGPVIGDSGYQFAVKINDRLYPLGKGAK